MNRIGHVLHRLLITAGIVLPIFMLVFEYRTHQLSGAVFDPMPDTVARPAPGDPSDRELAASRSGTSRFRWYGNSATAFGLRSGADLRPLAEPRPRRIIERLCYPPQQFSRLVLFMLVAPSMCLGPLLTFSMATNPLGRCEFADS